MMQALQGYKTYIVAVLMGAGVAAQMLGYLTADQLTTLEALLAALGLGTLRHAIETTAPPVEPRDGPAG
jgi:hypothetical protein